MESRKGQARAMKGRVEYIRAENGSERQVEWREGKGRAGKGRERLTGAMKGRGGHRKVEYGRVEKGRFGH